MNEAYYQNAVDWMWRMFCALGMTSTETEDAAEKVRKMMLFTTKAARERDEYAAVLGKISEQFSSDWPKQCQQHVRLARDTLRGG